MPDPTGLANEFLNKVIAWLWAVVLAAFAWGWRHTHQRIDTLQAEIGVLSISKADKGEFDRQRDAVLRILEKLEEQGKQLARIEARLESLRP